MAAIQQQEEMLAQQQVTALRVPVVIVCNLFFLVYSRFHFYLMEISCSEASFCPMMIEALNIAEFLAQTLV